MMSHQAAGRLRSMRLKARVARKETGVRRVRPTQGSSRFRFSNLQRIGQPGDDGKYCLQKADDEYECGRDADAVAGEVEIE